MQKYKYRLTLLLVPFTMLACNVFSSFAQPSPTAVVIVEPTSPQTPSDFPLTEAEVPRVSLEEAFTAYNAGAAIIVDVRAKSSYDISHIPGALHIPLGEFETNIAGIDLPKDEWIITYCT